ncbi:hypothetical protein V2I01_16935 [Micromonospora sp. BRA006-A]|nr:hypothetical protein [Micromonospora sp. BRA006-A]
MLLAAGIDRTTFAVHPFPIEQPEVLARFIPFTVTAFTTICDDWNVRKIEVLRSLGYNVQVLFRRDRQRITGSAVRHLIRTGDEAWTTLVPAACRDYLISLGIAARLQPVAVPGGTAHVRLP